MGRIVHKFCVLEDDELVILTIIEKAVEALFEGLVHLLSLPVGLSVIG